MKGHEIVKVTILLIASLQLFCASNIHGQATARQGEPPPGRRQAEHFRSPMILELPLVVVAPDYWGGQPIRTQEAQELRYFVCDGVSVTDLAMSAARKRSGDLKLRIAFTLSTEEGIDKMAAVQIDAMAGERVVQSATVSKIDAEEGKRASRAAVMMIPKTDVASLSEKPVLRLTVMVRDND